MLDRYLLFAGEDYYPEGGWRDFQSSHETIEEAKKAFSIFEYRDEWGHIFDLITKEIVVTFWRGKTKEGDHSTEDYWNWED